MYAKKIIWALDNFQIQQLLSLVLQIVESRKAKSGTNYVNFAFPIFLDLLTATGCVFKLFCFLGKS